MTTGSSAFLQTYPRVSSFQLHSFLNVASILRLFSFLLLFFRMVRLVQWGDQNCTNEAAFFHATPNKKAWNTTSFKIFSRAFKYKKGYFATLWHYTKQVDDTHAHYHGFPLSRSYYQLSSTTGTRMLCCRAVKWGSSRMLLYAIAVTVPWNFKTILPHDGMMTKCF